MERPNKIIFFLQVSCWIHSTFSIPSRWAGKQGTHTPHPGISPIADLKEGEDLKYHKYYQWVCFVLFLQAAFFYIPRYLWKTAEGGKIKLLIQGLQVRRPSSAMISNF